LPTFWKKPVLIIVLGTLKISPVESVRKRPRFQSIVPAGSLAPVRNVPRSPVSYVVATTCCKPGGSEVRKRSRLHGLVGSEQAISPGVGARFACAKLK